MTLKQIKTMFDDIVELCSQLEDHNIETALESFYCEVKKTKDPYDVFQIISELMFYVDEVNAFNSDIEDIKNEIQDLFNKIQDEME